MDVELLAKTKTAIMIEQTIKPKHPKGLWVLFGTEMWERFNFYGMRTILTLFIVNALMMSKEQSSIIYGGFLGLCYLTPMLGGFVADRFLGNRLCIMLGGLMMAVGQMLLFFSASIFSDNLELAKTLLYVALGIIIFGNGFLRHIHQSIAFWSYSIKTIFLKIYICPSPQISKYTPLHLFLPKR